MTTTLKKLRSLLLAVAVLLAGHGLQLTLLPLKGISLGWTTTAIGLTGSAYYVGFILGCLTIPKLIRRVGHIRVFAVTVAMAAIAVLGVSISENYAVWLGLRLVTGWSLAGLYMVIESWLNDVSENSQRGSVLAIYTMISLGAMVLGQLVITLEGLSLNELFPLAAILIVAATLPVALTNRPQPGQPAEVHFNWAIAFNASQVGVVCAGLSGLASGMLFTMGAIYASQATGGGAADGARFVATVIVGGLVLQYPMGRLSDRFDRRWLLLVLGGVGVSGALIGFLKVPDSGWLYLCAFLTGGATMPMYAISIAHANDNAEGRFLQIASGMLTANAVGAVLGPVVYAGMSFFPLPDAFMIILGLTFLLSVLWTALRMRVHPVTRDHYEPFQLMPKTTVEAAVMNPRGDSD